MTKVSGMRGGYDSIHLECAVRIRGYIPFRTGGKAPLVCLRKACEEGGECLAVICRVCADRCQGVVHLARQIYRTAGIIDIWGTKALLRS